MTDDANDHSQLDPCVAAYLASGDHAAFGQLWSASRRLVLSKLAGNLRNRDDVLEMEQEVWWRIHRRRENSALEPFLASATFAAFKKYVLCAVGNLIIEKSRKKLPTPMDGLEFDRFIVRIRKLSPEETLELKRCLEELRGRSKRDADLIESLYYDCETAVDLASQHELHPGNVRKRIRASLERLRKCIEGKLS